MPPVQNGDTVQVNYTGKLKDGTVFDTSHGRCPLQFTMGKGQLISGFEKAVLGMNTGERKTVVIPPDQAYGNRQDKAIVEIDRTSLPPDLNPAIGQRLELTQEDNSTVLVTVAGVTDATVTLDANHPLAGKDLTFDIELVSVAG